MAKAAGALILLLHFGNCLAAILAGRVSRVLDGDTIVVIDDLLARHTVRLSGIDAPEKGQPYSARARDFLAKLVLNRQVRIEWYKSDRYGRLVGNVYAPDGLSCRASACASIDTGLALISAGLAWWYRQYAKEQSERDRNAYEQAQGSARKSAIGLWSEPSPMPPWQLRRRRR